MNRSITPLVALSLLLVAGCAQRGPRAPAIAPSPALTAPPAVIAYSPDPELRSVCAQAATVEVRKPRLAAGSNTLPHADLYAALYQQHALEYRANALSTYRAAAAALPARLAEQRAARTGKPPVVVFDLDETVLDNSAFQGRALKEDREFDDMLWDCWVGQQDARLVPGAELLFQAMSAAGVRARFITNRRCLVRGADQADTCPQLRDTQDNLNRLLAAAGSDYQATADEFLLQGQGPWSDSEKKQRRAHVAAQADIVLLVGDDLGDFIDDAKSSTLAVRQQKFEEHDAFQQWGRAWFMLPNAMYGSWERTLRKEAPGQKIEAALRSFEDAR